MKLVIRISLVEGDTEMHARSAEFQAVELEKARLGFGGIVMMEGANFAAMMKRQGLTPWGSTAQIEPSSVPSESSPPTDHPA